MSWLYFKENGPLSERYRSDKEREKYKKWFSDHESFFEATKLFEFWKDDNKEIVTDFSKLLLMRIMLLRIEHLLLEYTRMNNSYSYRCE